MLYEIFKISKSDPLLAKLLDEVREYSEIYLIEKQRQKGCDEMGEVVKRITKTY